MKCILDTVQILKIAVSLSILDTVSKILPNPAEICPVLHVVAVAMIAVKYAPARLLKMSPLRVTNVAWNWLFSWEKGC